MPSFPVVLATSVGSSTLVEQLGLCVLAAGFLSAIFERLRIPTIAALLVAGVVLGPIGAHTISPGGEIETIANLGLTLCGGDASAWMYAAWASTLVYYGNAGGAQVIWVR